MMFRHILLDFIFKSWRQKLNLINFALRNISLFTTFTIFSKLGQKRSQVLYDGLYFASFIIQRVNKSFTRKSYKLWVWMLCVNLTKSRFISLPKVYKGSDLTRNDLKIKFSGTNTYCWVNSSDNSSEAHASCHPFVLDLTLVHWFLTFSPLRFP